MKVKGQPITDFPIIIKHKIGDFAMINQIKKVSCLYCKKDFFLNSRNIVEDREVHCSFCGEIHVNKSNIKFDLRKSTTDGEKKVDSEIKESISKRNAKKSTTSSTGKTTKKK